MTETNAIVIQGPLVFATVPEIHARHAGALAMAGGTVTVDIRDARPVDSSGIGMLVEWIRLAQGAGRSLQVVGPTEQFQHLVSVSGLDDLFRNDRA